ncbi:hypothetical protein D1007_56112 [Hordeum vulgare]|nr:hypothetical protein D1007_56112 [Hordeum vulgare]
MTGPLRSLLPLKTLNSRDLKRSCLFCAMDMGRPQRGVLLSKESTLAEDSYDKLVEDVNGLLDARERRAEVERKDLESSKLQEKYDMVNNPAAAQVGVIRNMKLKLAEERKNLQIHIDELQKLVEQSNVKLEGIKAIING